MRTAFFFLVLSLVLAPLGYYVHQRASSVIGLSRRGRRVLSGLLIAVVVVMIAGRLLRGFLPEAALRVPAMVGWLLLLSLIISSILLAAFDLAHLLVRRGGRLLSSRAGAPRSAGESASVPLAAAPPAPPASPTPEAPPLPRRDFLARGAASTAFLIGGGSSIYGTLVGRHDYALEEVPIRIPGLPRSLDGFSILQLSDIHVGLFVGEPELRAAEDIVRRARGDLIVLTGDLIDFDAAYAELLGRFVRRLQPLAREGVAAIPGNHDHFTGVEATLGAVERAGASVLRNRGRVVGGPGGAFALLGVDDVWAARMQVPGGGPDLGRALADVPPDLARVLLCHNPVFFPESAGSVALQLSGHTHGGQVNLLVRPADWVLPYGYVAGLYRRGDAQLYINRGFGTAGPPARLGAPPEVTRIVLVSA